MELAQVVLNGLLLGGVYAVMVLGFSIIWGVLRIVNLAHGEFVMFGALLGWVLFNPDRTDVAVGIGRHSIAAYALLWVAVGLAVGYTTATYWLRQRRIAPAMRWALSGIVGAGAGPGVYALLAAAGRPSLHPLLAVPVAALVAFAAGDLLQRAVLNRVIEREHLIPLLITFGTAIVMANSAQLIFGGDPRQIILGGRANFEPVAGLAIPRVRLVVFVTALLTAGLLAVWLARTRTGKTIRAASQHKLAARVVGIDIDRTYALTFGICVAITAAAGVLVAPLQPITPAIGPELTLKAFAITALGGLGSVPGALAGGITLGVAEALVGRYVGAGWAVALAFVVLVLVLLTRPAGLFGRAAPA
ncbi:MAG: branched-chain amino acid ABC transporter permease [Acidimicrobiales bacterium]